MLSTECVEGKSYSKCPFGNFMGGLGLFRLVT